jgi:hypothetical protein
MMEDRGKLRPTPRRHDANDGQLRLPLIIQGFEVLSPINKTFDRKGPALGDTSPIVKAVCFDNIT